MLLEGIYYFLPLNDITLNPTFTFRFSGKVFYKKFLFLKAAIGIQQFDFNKNIGAKINYYSFINFVNIGIGYKF